MPTIDCIDLTGDSDGECHSRKAVDRPRGRIRSEDVIELTDSEKEDSEEEEENCKGEYKDDEEERISEDESEGDMEEPENKKSGTDGEEGEEEEEELEPMSREVRRKLIYDAIDEAFSGGKARSNEQWRERVDKGRTAVRRSVKDIKVTLEDYVGPPPPSGERSSGMTSSRKPRRLELP